MTQAQPIPATALEALSDLVEARTGMRFAGSRQSELATRAARVFAESGCPTWQAYLESVSAPSANGAFERLVEALTVGETYFFRHRAYFDMLEREVLPEIIARRRQMRHLRLWCAGCATGEEAYSLAILVRRVLPDPDEWRVSILGTDLNREYLTRARAGIYSQWSFRETDAAFRNAYFTPEGTRYRIRPEFRRLVRFEHLNLASDDYPSAARGIAGLDVILCRNVLLYFSPELARQVVGRLREALVPDGWLMLGPSDPLPGLMGDFEMHSAHNAVAYRRTPAALLALPEPSSTAIGAHPGLVRRSPLDEVRPGLGGESPSVSKQEMSAGADWREALRASQACADRGALDEAEAHCQQAIARAPLQAEAHYLFGTLRQARGDDAAALAAFRRALYADPAFIPALLGQAAVHRKSGAQDRASRALIRAKRLLQALPAHERVLADEDLTVGRLRDVLGQSVTSRAG